MLSDPEFGRILQKFDLSWEGYRKVRKGVKKRLRRIWIELGLTRVEDFLAALEADPALHAECRQLLTVSVSRFFRDPELWRALEREILPALAGRETIRAWSAGCARGEEVYSLKIIHDQWQRRGGQVAGLDILAADLNPVYLAQARAGVYGQSSLREVPPDFRADYFAKITGKKMWRVDQSLREGIVWQEHDLLSEPAPGRFDLVLMRNNVLTYESVANQVLVLDRVMAGLLPGGFLIIGAKEDLPPAGLDLRPWPGLGGVFHQDSLP